MNVRHAMEGLYQERWGAAPGSWGALMGGKMDGVDCCQRQRN